MRRLGTVLLTLTLLSAASPTPAAVQFETGGFDAALQRAKQEDRLLLIDFYADWCGPCKLLDATTWQDEQVSALSKFFVNLKVDTEHGEGDKLASRYAVEALPTVVLLDADGKAVGREMGYQPPPLMLAFMRRALGRGDGAALLSMADHAPQDGQLQLEAARLMAELKNWDKATELLGRARTCADAQGEPLAGRVLLAQADFAQRQGRWTEASASYEAYIKAHADDPEAIHVRSQLAEALAHCGKMQEALEAFRDAARLKPDSVPVLNGFAWFCATERIGLDEALPAAEHAVELAGRAAGVLDTLAEVHYARGEYSQALKVIDEAIDREPRDPYYQQQRAKFLTAQQAHPAETSGDPSSKLAAP